MTKGCFIDFKAENPFFYVLYVYKYLQLLFHSIEKVNIRSLTSSLYKKFPLVYAYVHQRDNQLNLVNFIHISYVVHVHNRKKQSFICAFQAYNL